MQNVIIKNVLTLFFIVGFLLFAKGVFALVQQEAKC